MRISDWSSDVCSSDLQQAGIADGPAPAGTASALGGGLERDRRQCGAAAGAEHAPLVQPRLQPPTGPDPGKPRGNPAEPGAGSPGQLPRGRRGSRSFAPPSAPSTDGPTNTDRHTYIGI